MKKILLFTSALFAICFTASAQNIVNPATGERDNYSIAISKIETDKQYTAVTFDYTAPNDGAWIELNKEIFIQTDVDNKHYDFVKAENIAIVPEARVILKTAGDKHSFKVYFKKLPANAKTIDIIERPGHGNDVNYFNFYDVSLTAQTPANGEHVKVTEVVLAPPPVNMKGNNSIFPSAGGENNIFGAMSGMFGNLTKTMLDAQLNYYKQPGKIAEVAKLHKQYFDALVKEGFTYDQAIKILTAAPLVQKGAGER